MAHTFHRYKPGSEPVAGYKVTVCLGSGGFGEVWKGVGPGGTEVAIKIIDLTGQQGVQEFKSLRLVKKCTHPNLVPVHAFWLKDEEGNVVNDEQANLGGGDVQMTAEFVKPVELIIVMTLGKKCLNKRLHEVRDDGLPGIPPTELLDYMEGAARGIDYLNTQVGIVHGDIKPHNILIVGDAAAVCDFGLARAVESLRKTSMAPMTVAYAAPESFRGKPTVKSDQYSLAMTYIELRTGRMPFDEGLSPFDLMNTHVTGQLNLDRLPPYEREVIRRGVALNPDDRWNNNRDFIRALTRAFEADPQAKLQPGSPFEKDLEAEGFVATMKRDTRSSSLRGEMIRQTRENVNRGVTPTSRPSLMPDENALPYGDAYDFSDPNPAQSATESTNSATRTGVLIGAILLVLAGIGFVAMNGFGGGPKLSPQQQKAMAFGEVSTLVDRLTSERQFPRALDDLERFAATKADDDTTKELVARKREQVRTAWVALAEQARQENRASEADRLANDILARFPKDPQATQLLASNTPSKSTTPSTSTSSTPKFDVARVVRETDAQVAQGRWIEALERLETLPKSLKDEDDKRQLADHAAKLRARWLTTLGEYIERGGAAVDVAKNELSNVLARYPQMYEAHALLVRVHIAQSSSLLARAAWEKLQAVANLPPEGQQLRDALLLVLDLRMQKREPSAMYGELLKLTGLDSSPPPGTAWSLTAAERDLLRKTRDQLLDADFKTLAAAGRSVDQLALTEKLLTHYPAQKYELLLIKSEIQVEQGKFAEARTQIDAAEKLVEKLTPAQTLEHESRRLIIDLRDSSTPAEQRDSLVAKAEKDQSRWSRARRGDLGKAVVELAQKHKAALEPIAFRMLLAAVKLEPEVLLSVQKLDSVDEKTRQQRVKLYQYIETLRGDEWTPRVTKRLNDLATPSQQDWQQLYDDCVALLTLDKFPGSSGTERRRWFAIYISARAEAMCELGMKVDDDAKFVINLGDGWPNEGYIYYAGARVAWETQLPVDRVRALVTKANGVAQKPVQLNAAFRTENLRKMQEGASRPRPASHHSSAPTRLLGGFKRVDRPVFHFAQSPTSVAERRQLCETLLQQSANLPPPERIAAWTKVAELAESFAAQTPDATFDRLASLCHEELAATARVDMAEHFRAAIAAATRWIERTPNAAAYTARARVHIRFTALRGSGLDHEAVFQADRFTIGDRCEADLKRASELDGDDPEPQRWLGRLKREQGDARGGDENFARAIELARARGDRILVSLRDWVENALLLEQFDEARRRAEHITLDPPANQLVEVNRLASALQGEIAYRQQRWSESLVSFNAALPAAQLASATLDDLPLLLHRAECQIHAAVSTPPDAVTDVEAALADLAQAEKLALNRATQATIQVQAARHALRAVDRTTKDNALRGEYLARGLQHCDRALVLDAQSQQSVTLRVIQLKLLLAKRAMTADTAEQATLTKQCRALHGEARQKAEQTGLASELGELLQLEDRL